jgi:hypothetical protein
VYLEVGVDGKRKAAPRNMFLALSGLFPGEISCLGFSDLRSCACRKGQSQRGGVCNGTDHNSMRGFLESLL